jgi:hypothetical protein
VINLTTIVDLTGGPRAPAPAAHCSGFTLKISPDTGAPGAAGLQHAIDVVAFYTLISCAVRGLAGIATWAIGNGLHVQHLASGGKMGLMVALASAFAVGALAALINFFFSIA